MAKTRDRIAAMADDLFYRQGYSATSFADIAEATGLSRGNFYHHFKAKDAILGAVIDRRLHLTASLLAGWAGENPDPAHRIRCFIDILHANRQKILQGGCPVGTLCTELAKLDHLLLTRAADVFGLFRDWLAAQFAALALPDPDALALHLLARSQGIAVLYHSLRDPDFLEAEVLGLHRWLDSLLSHPKALLDVSDRPEFH